MKYENHNIWNSSYVVNERLILPIPSEVKSITSEVKSLLTLSLF